MDAHLNYQYRAFGVPGLGFKRGLADDLVIAPYASAHGLDGGARGGVPESASASAEERREGTIRILRSHRLYAVARAARARLCVVVRSFMAHHQGMSLLSFAYVLLDRPMQKRFAADLLFQATTLLLQERVPRAMALYSQPRRSLRSASRPRRRRKRPCAYSPTRTTPSPEVQLLSNGRYHVMVTNAGGGYSRWKDLAVTRWREDTTCDNWGTFCYVRDAASGEFWSTAYQPTLEPPDSYEAIFSERGWSSAAATAASTPTPRSRSRPKTISSCAASRMTNHLALAQDHRNHQLRGSGAGLGGRRCAASRVQQSVRAD